ncbi:cytochrome c3 family protein [Aliivibrio kagoshimensis]|uniref:cytochrome c3 family protein n=1 Tax=Aliivibrio kagoshimensis TaxID=2910230 RepID=UPI003D0E3C56
MSRVVFMLPLVILSLMIGASSQGYAEQTSGSDEVDQIFSSQVNSSEEMATLVKENKRCIRCHKKKRLLKEIKAIKSVGAHSSQTFYNNCTACHNSKGDHPKDNQSVILFSAHSTTEPLVQNTQCINCHAPTELRKAEWTHDVHMKPINCASCHSLHTASDPIIGIQKKKRISLCVDCHKNSKETE